MTDATTAPRPEDATATPDATATMLPPPGAAPVSPVPAAPDAAPAGEPPSPPQAPVPDAGAPAPPQPPSWLEVLPIWTAPALILGIPLALWLLGEAVPSFYDNVLWQYYWGPIKADAENVARLTHNGVVAHSGYNVVNTLTWALLLGLSIFGIAQMLHRLRTPMDARLIVAATAWVVVGSMAHVLEDTGLLRTPLQYLFITPPIYLLFGAFGIGAFLVGHWLKRVEARRGLPVALRMLWLVHVVLVLLWLAFWLKPWDQITHYVHPLWVTGFAVVSFFVVRALILRKGTVDPTQLCLTLSLGTYLLVGAYIVSFLRDPWMEPSDNAIPWGVVAAPALAGLVTLAVFAVARARAAKGASWAPAYMLPINLLIVFGQMVDAFATSIGIDLAGYEEKHVLSAAIIDEFRELSVSTGFGFGARYPTFLAFATVKLLVSLLVIYAIDVYSKDDAKTHPTMIGLVKFAIIMVGIGPGVRDFVRLALGV